MFKVYGEDEVVDSIYQIGKDDERLKEEGNRYYKKKEYHRAIDCYRKAIQINPRYSESYTNLGVALRSINKTEEAIDCYRKAIQINSQNSESYNNLGVALYETNKTEEAIDCFRKAIQINPKDAAVYNNMGFAY